MEPVTHFLSGAVLSRAGFNRRTAYATLAMTLAAEMPDLDMVWYLKGPVAGFQHHRGITHTLLGAPFEALVVTAVMWGIHRMRRGRLEIQPRWFVLWCFSMLAVLLHILLDYTNNYGVRPLFPFSSQWHAWSTVFIIDPFLLLVFTLALVLPAIFNLTDREMTRQRAPFRGRGLAITALALVALYYGLRSAEHSHAMELARLDRVGVVADDGSSDQPVVRVDAEPFPFNPFHWHVIVETPGWFQTADVLTLTDTVTTSDKNDRIAKPPVTAAVAAAKQSWLGRVYLAWSKFPVTRDAGSQLLPDDSGSQNPNATEVDFEDLRFAYSAVPGSNEGKPPLGATVYVAPGGRIAAMYMGEKQQK